MTSQTNKSAAAEKKPESADKPKRSIKNPFLYAGTLVILVITVVAFVIVPAMGGGASGSGQSPSFGSWAGKPISYTQGSYFAQQVARINDYLRQQGLTEENFQLYAYQVWRMAFESAAVRTAVLDTVSAAGFRVSSKGLDEAVAADASFQVDGKFSAEKYRAATMATRLALRDSLKEELGVARYYEDTYTIAPSTAETAFVASIAKPRRTVSYASFPLVSFPDSEVATWGAENAALFRSIGIGRITVTSSLADAQKILKQVKDNSLSFEDAAKSHSKDAYADKGGDAGTLFYYQLASDFSDKANAEKVMALRKGEVSDVYKLADKVWVFYRVNTEAAAADFAKIETLAEARNYLYMNEKGKLESWAIARADKLAASAAGKDFAAAAKAAGIPVKEAGPFVINSGKPSFAAYGQSIPLFEDPNLSAAPELLTASEDEAFLTEAFSLAKGKVSRPLVLGDNVILFSVKNDADATDADLSMVKFAYPYFHQQTIDLAIRDSFTKDKRFKDNFAATFTKLFTPAPAAKSTKDSSTATTVAPATTDTTVSGS